jgi:hypothetical protein
VQRAVAREFDGVHNVGRALEVGSLNAVFSARELRPALCERLHSAVALHLARRGVATPAQ